MVAVPYPHAPNEDGRPWQDSTLLAGGCPMRSEDLSHCEQQPLVLCSTPIKRWPITGICCSPCCVHMDGEAGVSSQGVKAGVGNSVDVSLGSVVWRTGCCLSSVLPLSTSVMDPKEQQAITVWHQRHHSSCQK